jgi:hypothetical protein
MPVRASTVGAVVLMLVSALAVQAARFLPSSVRLRVHAVSVLDVAALVSTGIVTFLVVLAVAAVALMTRLPDWHEESASEEEPFLPEPSAPPSRGRSSLIGFSNLEPGAGASTLAFNLAVLVAAEGIVLAREGVARRPRPLCLLSDGELTGALGLDPGPLERHLDRHSGRIGDDLVDVATRHPSGCELLCIPRGRMGRHQLRLLRLAFGSHYDLIVVDAAYDDSDLRVGVEDTADVLVAVTLPSLRSAEAATRLLEGAGRGLRLATTVLLVNGTRAETRPVELALGFGHLAAFPNEHLVAEADLRGVPWSLAPDSTCRRVLLRFAHRLLPGLFEEAADAVAV